MYGRDLKIVLLCAATLATTSVPAWWLAKETFFGAAFESGYYLLLLPLYPVVWICSSIVLACQAERRFWRQ
ncbi:hypothetical protein [Rhizobium leucaenae]|uniref:Uncharacterized protein n=1 Tax=Rhizobium leucaenae TaxID=29450 RepID=A0A7W6ZYS2_9HYPH|nr:hypothetical protein [Rhizobium leucaenae]MBB4571129.1 hypothetical protein [Rhizobium leucaenae]MBB6304223.1 hypothetical protein [Rhizobium leucaenae]